MTCGGPIRTLKFHGGEGKIIRRTYTIEGSLRLTRRMQSFIVVIIKIHTRSLELRLG